MFGIKLYMFRTIPLYIIRSFSLYSQQWYMSYGFADSWRAGSGCSTACEQDQDETAVPSWSCSQAEDGTAVRLDQYVRQLASRIRTKPHFRPDPARKLRTELQFVLILLARCQQTTMTYTIAVWTVKNVWWWAEELSETCVVLFQK